MTPRMIAFCLKRGDSCYNNFVCFSLLALGAVVIICATILGFHQYDETPTNIQNHLCIHELNDRLKNDT
jgi:hypothetical protein